MIPRPQYLVACLGAAAVLLYGLGTAPAEAADMCQPAETVLDRPDSDDSCNPKKRTIDDTRSARSETRSPGTRSPRNEVPEPRPIRVITEGGSTTFTAPVPSDRQIVKRCANHAGEAHSPTPVFRSDGTLVCKYGSSSITTWGPCHGPYTVEIMANDDRITPNGQQIRVTTDAQDNLEESGTLVIEYLLHGTRTETFSQAYAGSVPQVDRAVPCTLLPPSVRVDIRRPSRPGMSAAVALHAPSAEYLRTPQTVNITCEQYINLLPELQAGCTPHTLVRVPEFPTPRRCVVVVTVATDGRGHGSTDCLTRTEVAQFEEQIEANILAKTGDAVDLNIASLPPCPTDSTTPEALGALDPDSTGRKRCVARN